MQTLEEVKHLTDEVFVNNDLKVPEPSISWQRKLEALEDANLESQRIDCLFEMRCEQAEILGFNKIDSSDMVEMLMGEKSTHNDVDDDSKSNERQTHEFFYNHHTDKTVVGDDCTWGSRPTKFWRMERKNLWFLPPFSKIETWRCQFGKLDYLKREIPYGVVLRINEVKELNLFNVFNVLAPMEAWEKKTDIDPIVVATIWSIEYKDGRNTAGQVAHFFLAQW